LDDIDSKIRVGSCKYGMAGILSSTAPWFNT
jgi:hypothetical protein